jgi:hypothetical protein
MVNKTELLSALAETDSRTAIPMVIPSWNRPNPLCMRWIKNIDRPVRDSIYLLVRKEQALEYEKNNPEVTVLPIEWDLPPESAMATTRQYILELAKSAGWSQVVQMDDDIMNLTAVFSDLTASGGQVSHKLNKKEQEVWQAEIYLLMCRAARTAFAEVPNLLTMYPEKMVFAFSPELSRMMYRIGKVRHTWAMGVFNMDVIKRFGLSYETKFNVISEDIGLMLSALDQGCQVGLIPSILRHQDAARESVIRTNDRAKTLNNYEPHILQGYWSSQFIEVAEKYDDGTTKGMKFNWKRYHEIMGTNPYERNWDGTFSS